MIPTLPLLPPLPDEPAVGTFYRRPCVRAWLTVAVLVGILMLKQKRGDQSADAIDDASACSKSTKDDGK